MWKREERIVVVVKRSLNSHSRFIEEDAIRLLRNDPSKVDLWRSFEGQQGGIQFRLTEKEKKTDFAASPTGRILWLCRLSYSFFFSFFLSFRFCREHFCSFLFPVTSGQLPWNVSILRLQATIDGKLASIVADRYHRLCPFSTY